MIKTLKAWFAKAEHDVEALVEEFYKPFLKRLEDLKRIKEELIREKDVIVSEALEIRKAAADELKKAEETAQKIKDFFS